MRQKISVSRQITLNRLRLSKFQVLEKIPSKILDKNQQDPLLQDLRALYLQYSNMLLQILRYLAPEAGFVETSQEDIAKVTEYGTLVDVITGTSLEELVQKQQEDDDGIIVDFFEKNNDTFVIYIFDPKQPTSSPTIAIHDSKKFEDVFKAELENIKLTGKDKLIFGGTITLSVLVYFVIDDIVDIVVNLLGSYPTNIESEGPVGALLAASVFALLILLRFGGKIIPRALKNLGAALLGVKQKNRLHLRAKKIMSKRTDSRRVFVDLYTQARMPVDDDVGYDKNLDQYLDNLEEILYGSDNNIGLLKLLDKYWEREQKKWNKFPRKFVKKIPLVNYVVPSNIR